MSYKLVFKEEALKEWKELDPPIRENFKSKLKERMAEPRRESPRLRGMPDCYKIKLRGVGYSLVYPARDQEMMIAVIAVGKRDKNLVYKITNRRI